MFKLIMPRKRTRAFAQINESQSNFHCKEAKARYENVFRNQQMHAEKGFTLKESDYIDFMACIHQVAETLNWELFCEKRPSVVDKLVHEFYANLTSTGDFVLQQRVEESEDLEEEEEKENPIEIEPVQSAEVPNKVEPMELEVEPNVETSMFRAQLPRPDLPDEL
ncbi:hypothetical protein PVK06_030278 [Gossypium arboreum]|uniref:Uncharacterized protein n=1 Tax=Gossypium arboreum TaxID=29729 RepID=A0ABR0NN26_GOSAR|nr:hypothetical protein PVK06_030278 [Gossypium arboreum]